MTQKEILFQDAPVGAVCYSKYGLWHFRKHDGKNVWFRSSHDSPWRRSNLELKDDKYRGLMVTITQEKDEKLMSTGYSTTITTEKTIKKTKIKIKNKTYFLNVPVSNLVSAGHISLDTTIKDIQPGDKFQKTNHLNLMIIQTWNGEYVMGGLGGNELCLFSDKPKTKEAMIKYLNDCGYVKLEK